MRALIDGVKVTVDEHYLLAIFSVSFENRYRLFW